MKRIIPFCTFFCFFAFASLAYKGPEKGSRPVHSAYRSECITAQAQIVQGVNRYLTDLTGIYTKVNNVRAHLLTGGDMWWTRQDAAYIVPHPDDPNEQGVSSIFAAGLWLGAFDPSGNLKTACQTYGNTYGSSDFWPGPLDLSGETEAAVCYNWDRFFEVYAEEIELHRSLLEAAANGIPYDSENIPAGVKGWPARGNPYFEQMYGFPLPATDQGLAEFWDENGDELYNPLDGDYPILSYQGCEGPKYADQMIFWIYNDHGSNIHAQSMGVPLQVEIQALAFSFGTGDAINDMTFQRHKIISRNAEPLDSMFFGLWVDADLGCYMDDYIGCDTTRSLAYVYNADDVDGDPLGSCMDIPTYGEEIPILGIDFLRGSWEVSADTINGEVVFDTVERGMTSFMYYNNSGLDVPYYLSGPNAPEQFYNLLTAHWIDGYPLYYGGDGYSEPGLIVTHFAFPSAPNDSAGWSMCTVSLSDADRRMVMSSGPGTLQPGEISELIFGLPWVANQDYPCPDLSPLLAADDLAQEAFDNCFELYVTTDTKEVAGEGQGPLSDVSLYPNPVYKLSGMGPVISVLPGNCDVSIYTAGGVLVSTYHSRQEGESDWQWDMRDLSGRPVSPGLYLIRISVPGLGERVLKSLVY